MAALIDVENDPLIPCQDGSPVILYFRNDMDLSSGFVGNSKACACHGVGVVDVDIGIGRICFGVLPSGRASVTLILLSSFTSAADTSKFGGSKRT